MSEIDRDLKPLFECALKTLEFILKHKDEISKIDPREAPYHRNFEISDRGICVCNGLCDNILGAFSGDLESYLGDPRRPLFFSKLEAWASAWPNYSGQADYPVPMPEYFIPDWTMYKDDTVSMDEQSEETKAYAAFHACNDEDYNMYADEYGQLRFQLAEFWVGKLKEKLHEINRKS